MVVVPAGAFSMGSPANEKGRIDIEIPHVVSIGQPFAVGRLHVTVDQYAAFVRETGQGGAKTCRWNSTGFAQGGSHPVVCVSFDDARDYVAWLAKRTGQPYRLISEAEWEYAARGRTSPGAYSRFWFGDDEKLLCRCGNFNDRKAGSLTARAL
jgi:formylglycine-generating enzyme required for sulfatase activity